MTDTLDTPLAPDRPSQPAPDAGTPAQPKVVADPMRAAWTVALERIALGDLSMDPGAWARYKLGVHLWSRQLEIAASLVDVRKTAVRSSHGIGKSFLAAILALWWIDTHPPGQAMVITTAPSYDQVHGVLWENIRRLHQDSNLPGTVQQSDRWVDDQGRLVGFGRRPPDHADSAFQGYHHRYILVILDEAGGIPDWLWTATKALTTGAECRVLAIGNPTDNASEFANLRSMDTWRSFQIGTFDTPNFTGEIESFPDKVRDSMRATLPSREWQEDALAEWGEESSLYQVRVLGEFADSDDGLIPMSWVAKAHRRWQVWHDEGEAQRGGPRRYGVDPAWLGDDMTAIACREADVIRWIERKAKQDTMVTAGRVEALLGFPGSSAIVDVNGIGAGVVDYLRHRRARVIAFNSSEATSRMDSTNQWSFPNCRSAAWYNLRELLDPSRGSTLALPPAPEGTKDFLLADLTTPRYWATTGAKYVVEPKKDQRKRLQRSPDVGDSVAMALWLNPGSAMDRDPEHYGSDKVRRKRRAHSYGSPLPDWAL